MPDIPNRDEAEGEIARLLAKWFGGQKRTILNNLGNPPNLANLPPEFWADVEKSGNALLRPFFAKHMLESSGLALGRITIGVDWALVNEAAANWAKQYTFDLVKNIDATSLKALNKIIPQFFEGPLTIGELRLATSEIRDGLGRLYGPVRGEMIAVTEVTRSAFEGELLTIKELESQGIVMNATWSTNNDDRVCNICEPLNGKPATGYNPGRRPYWHNSVIGRDVDPPPSHVRCRCWVNWSLPNG